MSGKIPKRIINCRRFKGYGSGSKKSGLVSSIGRSSAVARMLNIRSTNTSAEQEEKQRGQITRYLLTTFSNLLKDELNNNQKELLSHFENYNFVNKIEGFNYNSNTERAIVYLYQKDFENGTLRIKKPGIYVLRENISFNPNIGADSLPTTEQNSSGLYPSVGHSAYRLGFFAAITVETDDVIIDLNGHTLEQAPLHFLQQRFYANIEVASAPFIGPQGPGVALGENDYRSGNKVLIMNGILGRSSHHGIHSNFNQDVVFHNLTIENFLVAGIAMNGLTNGIFNNVTVQNSTTENPVLFSYSQARFIRPILDSIPADFSMNIQGLDTTCETIRNELDVELETTKTEFLSGDLISSSLFNNTNTPKDSDGNIYGIALNVTGVLVNDFLDTRPTSVFGGNFDVRNDFIHLQNITINNVSSGPRDIIGIDVSGNSGLSGYTSNNHLVKGPFGDVFDANFTSSEDLSGTYVQNTLANAQAIIGKYKLLDPSASVGTGYITQPVLDWISGSEPSLYDIVENDNPDLLSFEYGIDAMAHIMKGNIGLFLSGADNITGKDINVSNIGINGENQMDVNTVKGKHAYGILEVASDNISLSNVSVNNVTSSYGSEFETDISGTITN